MGGTYPDTIPPHVHSPEHPHKNMPHAHRFIDPRTLAAIKDLSLIARTVVDGFMFGGHQSRMTGAGLEFNQYRSYEPGDDLRRIDWKLYARSDRFYVRESEVETSVNVRFMLDASASMLHEEDGLSKFDYGRWLMASLAYLAGRQGDAIGLYTLQDRLVTALEPQRGPQQVHRLLHRLEEVEAVGTWPAWAAVEKLFTASPHRDLVVFVTDLHEQQAEIRTVLTKVQALKNEVLLFHVLGRREHDFAYEGTLEFEELETGRLVQVDADRIRQAYREALERHLADLRRTMYDLGVSYHRFFLDEPLDQALRAFLTRRLRTH